MLELQYSLKLLISFFQLALKFEHALSTLLLTRLVLIGGLVLLIRPLPLLAALASPRRFLRIVLRFTDLLLVLMSLSLLDP